MNAITERPTIPAPAVTLEAAYHERAVADYVRASERVAAALKAQHEAIQALNAFDSRHPVVCL